MQLSSAADQANGPHAEINAVFDEERLPFGIIRRLGPGHAHDHATAACDRGKCAIRRQPDDIKKDWLDVNVPPGTFG